MARVRSKGAPLPLRLRREIQRRTDLSNRQLAIELGVNPKTIDKWKRRPTVADAPPGPRSPASTVLTRVDEAMIVVFRSTTRLGLDDCLTRLKPLIPLLSRSALHRCLRRYGVNRVPVGRAERIKIEDTRRNPGLVTIRMCQVEDHGSARILFIAVSMLTRWVFARSFSEVDAFEAAEFLADLAEAAPFRLREVQTTDHEIFVPPTGRPWNPDFPKLPHPFVRNCRRLNIKHSIETVTDHRIPVVGRGWPKSRGQRHLRKKSQAQRRIAKRTPPNEQAGA